MRDDVTIEKCGESCAKALARLTEDTFRATFSHSCSAQDMQLYVDTSLREDKFAAELRAEDSLFFAAVCGGQIVGYIKLNVGGAQSEDMGDDMIEIARLYVAVGAQHGGIGGALMDRAFALAHERGAKGMWLGVWEHNERAKSFYAARGFSFCGAHDYWVGNDRQTDLLMRIDFTDKR